MLLSIVFGAASGIAEDELLRTFNMGVGYCVIVRPKDAPGAAALLRDAGETVCEIGEIAPGTGEVVYA